MPPIPPSETGDMHLWIYPHRVSVFARRIFFPQKCLSSKLMKPRQLAQSGEDRS